MDKGIPAWPATQTNASASETVRWLRRVVEPLSDDALVIVRAGDLRERLADEGNAHDACVPAPVEATWRERFCTVPDGTRMNAHEVAEAIGKPISWLYRRTSERSLALNGRTPIPHRKLDGALTFIAGEVREWLKEQEER
jgi:predicted DNA-binding transcriptional regulator AlpA